MFRIPSNLFILRLFFYIRLSAYLSFSSVHPSINPSKYSVTSHSSYTHPIMYFHIHPSAHLCVLSSTHSSIIHVFSYPFIYSSVIHPSPIYPFILPSIHPFTHPFIHVPIDLFIHPSIHPLTYSFIHLSIYPFTHPFILPFIHPFVHPSIHSPIHSSVHSPIHSSIHMFTHPFIHPSIDSSIY